ncbi:hypothetical protein BKA66DRAFT_469119 [Pyrenochaeta sp. MPI-SDFR-AT-0127]|nr:hypothetical protein BKA66DRAFT_469119 [Pyrenochaeta sp. MPI-SDFR-AT-0127]
MPDPTTTPVVYHVAEATKEYLCPNPSTTTRSDFTDFFLRFQHALDAHPVYIHLFTTHQQLMKLLIEHPAMKPNLKQTFDTKANSKNKVYFTWDFLLRTFQHIASQIDPGDPYGSPMFGEVVHRSVMAKSLIIDDTGTLEAMNSSAGYSDDEGVDFGDQIKELAKTLDEFPDCCAGCGNIERENGARLLICARCKKAKYCSVDCQKSCWKEHKNKCKA